MRKEINLSIEEVENYKGEYAFWHALEERGFPVKYEKNELPKIEFNDAIGAEFAAEFMKNYKSSQLILIEDQVKQNKFDCSTDVTLLQIQQIKPNEFLEGWKVIYDIEESK